MHAERHCPAATLLYQVTAEQDPFETTPEPSDLFTYVNMNPVGPLPVSRDF